MDGSYNDYVDSSKQYAQPEKAAKYGNQQREKQSSRLSNRSSHDQEVRHIDDQQLECAEEFD